MRRPSAAGATTVIDDGSGFGLGVIAGVIVAIAIAVLAVLWATGTFRGTSHNNPGTTVTSTAPGSNGSTGTTGGTGTGKP